MLRVCTHAQPTTWPDRVYCTLGEFGGEPCVAQCKSCERRRIPDEIPPTGTPGERAPKLSTHSTPHPALSPTTPVVPAIEALAPPDLARSNGEQAADSPHQQKLLIRCGLSPGDVVTLTATIRDLHRAYPGRFTTHVQTTAPEIWENNPYITPFPERHSARDISMHYPLINQSNQRPVHFLQGYCDFLSSQLGLPIPLTEFKGDIHLSDQERSWTNQVHETFGYRGQFWVLIAGGKYDFTAKWWAPAFYQEVVDHFLGRVQFVQCGDDAHWHPSLKNVFNLVGKTSIRQFIRLIYHAEGVICPVTFAMHLAAAIPIKNGRLRPCVVIAGGREPAHWEAYPGHQFLHTIGSLPCCATGGCWRSRCQPVGDGDSKDRDNVCERPIQIDANLRIPQCMAMIKPRMVIDAIERSLSFYS